jgi:hypothetical protein
MSEEKAKAFGRYSYAKQKGTPGNCWVAQVWEDGEAFVEVWPTQDPKVASERAEQLARMLHSHGALLAAARAMFAELYREYGNAVRNGYFPAMRPVLERGADAIAKATGEPPVDLSPFAGAKPDDWADLDPSERPTF